MNPALQTDSSTFTNSARDRLTDYLARQKGSRKGEMVPLTPDASTREYFRIPWKRKSAVAAVYPAPFDAAVHPYLDITRLFLESGLPVPEVHDVDGAAGIIVQEDLGDRQLFQVFEAAADEEREGLLEAAIDGARHPEIPQVKDLEIDPALRGDVAEPGRVVLDRVRGDDRELLHPIRARG